MNTDPYLSQAFESLKSREVAVVRGGRSSEREVSLKSGAAIAAGLRDNADGRGPARVHDVLIRADGAWMFADEPHAPSELLARLPEDTLFVLGLHGGEGEDGTIQGLFATSRRTHTGSGVGASALCMNKSWTRQVLRESGLAVAPGIEVHPQSWREERAAILARCAALGARGFAVKPNRGGSSVATFLVNELRELPDAIDRVLATGDRALVEARIVGSEATCGVLGNERSTLRALMPVEIVPNDGRFFDYEEKYSSAGAREFCPPKNLGQATCDRIRELSVRAHRAAACDGYSRIDFMIPRDEHGRELEPVVLEINTLPGMTDRSLLPQAAAAEGLSFRDLCLEIAALALLAESP
jgi:D-alanine-D-alanine ligase